MHRIRSLISASAHLKLVYWSVKVLPYLSRHMASAFHCHVFDKQKLGESTTHLKHRSAVAATAKASSTPGIVVYVECLGSAAGRRYPGATNFQCSFARFGDRL